MTIEGRPEIKYDWEASYRKQRRERLNDSIAEYLNDDMNVSPRQCYEEVLASVEDWIDYHKKNMERWVEFKMLMHGRREVDFSDELATKWQYDKINMEVDPQFLTEDRNSNFPGENTLT